MNWKRLAIVSLVGGGACGVVLLLGFVAFYFYQQRPKPWDTRSLHTVNAKAEPIDRLDEKFQPVSTGVSFTIDVENATAGDITLPSTLTIMQEAKGSHALHGSLLKLDRDYFIPARHVATIWLDSTELCAPNYDPRKCFDNYFANDAEIVIFQNESKYELRIPIPSLTLPTNVKKKQ